MSIHNDHETMKLLFALIRHPEELLPKATVAKRGDFVRAWRESIRRGLVAQAGNEKRIDYTINERAALAQHIQKVMVDGKYGLVIDGMDCDCSRYHREHIHEWRGAVIEHRANLDEYADAEGPHSLTYVRPDEINVHGNWSRDLALEAYEDGHPHVVYY